MLEQEKQIVKTVDGREIIEFSKQEDKLDSIIEEINAGKFPKYRYVELLHENLFETYEDREGLKKVGQAQTFIAYAAAKLNPDNLEEFLDAYVAEKLRSIVNSTF